MTKNQLRALTKGGGRFKHYRVGQAWNTWHDWAKEVGEHKRIAKKAFKYLHSQTIQAYAQQWRDFARGAKKKPKVPQNIKSTFIQAPRPKRSSQGPVGVEANGMQMQQTRLMDLV